MGDFEYGKMPLVYEYAAKALTELNTKKGSLRQIMEQFSPKIGKAVYAVTTKVLRNLKVIKDIIVDTDLQNKVKCDPALLEVLVAELLYVTSKLPVKYLRINLLKCSMEEIIQMLESKGYSQVVLEDCNSFESFLKSASEIEHKKKTFLKDFHFPEELLVVGVRNTPYIMAMEDYKNGKFIFFDKASLLAVEMLKVKKGMTVLDICAAPGMKTAAIASRCDNDLKIVSLDRDWKRCGEMKSLMSTLGVTCVDIHCADFLGEHKMLEGKIDAILLDPSCSGSGMVDRLDYSENNDTGRCFKLASFQTKMLCKAMSLKPKRIVYSTCSLSETENEFVIRSALKEAENGDEYELVKGVPTWPMRGEKGAKQCIRSD
ncbi:putative 28S rRNA (cytosine-C(5))-methyltransferase-like protein, partial [Leptotrombidium deliense]